MSRVFLFTTLFPFGKGESFLEQEVPFLAQGFDEVTVMPTRRLDASHVARPLPEGVRLDLSLTDRSDDITAFDQLAFKVQTALRESLGRPGTPFSRSDLRRLWFYMRKAARARRWVQAAGLDQAENTLLYTFWLDGTTYGLTAACPPGVTVVSRVHNGDLYEEQHPSGYLPLLRATAARLDRLFPVSAHGRDHLIGRWPELADRVAVSRLGVPDPGHTTSASSDGKLRIVTCSHINPVKRIPLIMEGIGRFARDHPEVQVVWRHIGDGPDRDALSKAAARKLPDTVDPHFLGWLPPGGVIEHYRGHLVDLFLNASSTEGVPVSIMEAQSCGIPVIATAVGGSPEIVNDHNGCLLPPDPTPADIASAIEVVRGDEARRIQSKETWRDMSRAERVYPEFIETLERLGR